MQLKSKPADFIVEEINTIKISEGKYSVYKLKKTNMDTFQALQIIANKFSINKKYINIAGTKDKVAITTQYISISRGPENGFKDEKIELEFVGKTHERIALGQLDGNKFTLIIRDISEKEQVRFKRNKNNTIIPNYYDDQRFGIQKNNHIIGRHMIKKEWKQAVEELTKQNHYPNNIITNYLKKHATDYIGALRKLPKKLLLMFIYAYQSYLFNETVKELVRKQEHRTARYNIGELYFPEKSIQQQDIPLIGFDIECDNEEVHTILEKIMKQENITSRDFIIRQMPELSASGTNRPLLSEVKDFSHTIDNDTIKLQFSLGKGSYATIVMKALFC
jgi:tRNA pseudouridine13 synthase